VAQRQHAHVQLLASCFRPRLICSIWWCPLSVVLVLQSWVVHHQHGHAGA
jgi:hypothetical protein